MSLNMGSPALNNDNRDLTPQQQRSVELEQSIANLSKIEHKIDQAVLENDVFAKYPKEAREVLKDALIKEVYHKVGENSDIRSLSDGVSAVSKENYISAKVGEHLYVSIKPDPILEDYAQNNPGFDFAGLKQSFAEQAEKLAIEKQLNLERNALSEAIDMAANERAVSVQQRNAEITEIKSGLLGFFKKAPDKIPSVEEFPLTKEEILKHVDPKIVESGSFQALLNTDLLFNQLNFKQDTRVLLEVSVESLRNFNEDFRTQALYFVEGLPKADLRQILNIENADIRNDVINLVLTVDYATNLMTEEGRRIETTVLNNTYGWINSKILDCGGQAENAINTIDVGRFNRQWNTFLDSSSPIPLLPGHSWGIAYVANDKQKLDDNFPWLTYDPRARSFGFNRFCDSCNGALGFSEGLSKEMYMFSDYFEGKK